MQQRRDHLDTCPFVGGKGAERVVRPRAQPAEREQFADALRAFFGGEKAQHGLLFKVLAAGHGRLQDALVHDEADARAHHACLQAWSDFESAVYAADIA